jgi:outer membrane immunogenic protein
MKMHRVGFLAFTLSSVVALAAANAADLSGPGGYKDAPYAYDWSGIYVGGNGGGVWADPAWSFPVPQFFAATPPFPRSFSTELSGGLGGGQVGINKQFGSFVLGAEVTGDWTDLKQTKVGPVDPAFPNDKWTTKIQDLETITMRLGYANNTWLFYGKTGAATGTVSLSALSGPPVPGVTFGEKHRLWGFDLGAGTEYALTRNIIVGVEYNFVQLDGGNFSGSGHLGAASIPVIVSNKSDFDVQSVTGRVSYKFGSVYAPLK